MVRQILTRNWKENLYYLCMSSTHLGVLRVAVFNPFGSFASWMFSIFDSTLQTPYFQKCQYFQPNVALQPCGIANWKNNFQLGLDLLCLCLLKLITHSGENTSTFCKGLSSHLEWDIQKKSCMVPFPMDFLACSKICSCVRKRCMAAHDLHPTTTLPVHPRPR